MSVRAGLVLATAALLACGSGKTNVIVIGGPPQADTTRSDGTEIGSGDGSPGSVTLTEIYTAQGGASVELVDLQFNANDPTEVWAVGYGNDSVHLGQGVADGASGSWRQIIDPAARHFMHKPVAIAWGADGFWGTCGDNDNAQNNPRNEGDFFMGPALFTSDLGIFAKATPDGLGSHYDMLHNTSMCRGLAHVDANVFWAFNGDLGALERYHFNAPHGPGEDDHRDGEIYRYAEGQVKGVLGVSSHVFYDASDAFLYVADTGNQRIVRLDTTAGTEGGPLPRRNETLKKNAVMVGAVVEVLVPPGVLSQPSGLEVHGDALFVTDAATGRFYAFDKTGNQLRTLDTGLGAGALSGFTFGPDGKIWLTDRKRGKVLRLDPLPAGPR